MNDVPQDTGNVSIVLCPDGPILVRGEFDVVTPSGEPVPRQRKTVALCRCGASAIKPYCDGTHKLINFRTEAPSEKERPAAPRRRPSSRPAGATDAGRV